MRISERYTLNKTQAELDFIDIDTNFDIPLFIDPFFLSIRNDNWSIEATRTIKSFFQRVIDLLSQGDTVTAKNFFNIYTNQM